MEFRRFSYIVVLGSLAFLAYAVHDSRTRREEGADADTPVAFISQVVKANKNWVPNDTVTGNILAANFAQGQRDWKMANYYIDKLNNAAASDATTQLRMMLLAVSAGQYDRAAEYAHLIQSQPKAANDEAGQQMDSVVSDGRDLASLIIMAQAVRAGDLASAEARLQSVESTALRAFIEPVISCWLRAGQNKPVDGNTNGLSLLQALHRGLAAEWAGQKDTSNRIFDALAKAPLTSVGSMMVAAYDIRNTRAEQARAALTAALKLNPLDQDAKKMLDALSQGQSPALRPEFSYHMKGVTAGVAMAFRDLAQMMIADRSNESALIFAQMGRYIRPDVPGLSILVGNIFADQKRYDEAAAALQSIQPQDLDYVDAQIRLSELKAEQEDVSDATKILESLMQSNPSPRVAFALGEIYRAEKDNKKAVTAYDQAIDAAGGTPDDSLWSIYFVRAMALDELGEWDKAEADLKKALSYRPDDPHVLNYLAYSWADRNVNLVQAREMLLKALVMAPTDPFITDSLGWVYYRQGDYTQAIILLERAVSLKPYDPVLNGHLGDVYHKAGRTLEARYQWQRALDYADHNKDEKLVAEMKAKLEGKSEAQEK
ncbi:MAG: tetratricopeptide repeat protein [Alphaproteobacteria bacterium]|nr:tetratricopeptide repeat protein [Alphaproteobacteria bacterium]